jgi:hypothetical protein
MARLRIEFPENGRRTAACYVGRRRMRKATKDDDTDHDDHDNDLTGPFPRSLGGGGGGWLGEDPE